jgi:hypothetical protein
MLKNTAGQQTQDPLQLYAGWRWHAMNVLIFCKIHFTRTVYKLIPETGNATETAEARNRLLSLTECQTREDYQLLTDLIKGKRLFC